MKSINYNLVRYDADEGKVFDWKNLEEHIIKDEEEIQFKSIYMQRHYGLDTLIQLIIMLK